MKPRALKFTTTAFLSLLLLTVAVAAARASAAPPAGEDDEVTQERQVATEPNVTVLLCVESGDIVVRGWDRREVRARSEDAEQLELRRVDATATAKPATRVEVLISNSADEKAGPGDCQSYSNVELDVPRAATVVLKARSGNIEVADVAEARVETLNGDVELRRISKVIEAVSISGDVFVKDARGSVRLRSVSGDVEAADVRANETGDFFKVNSTSGEINLIEIGHMRVEAITVNGDVSMNGPLASGGVYDFKTTTGNVTLTMPGDSSFRLNARVVASGEIVTDFLIKTARNPAAPTETTSERLIGIYDKGDAELNLSSFNGTIHLRRK